MRNQAIAGLVWLFLACSGSGPPEPEPQAGGVVSDTQALAEAEAAANEILRNAGDCQAVSASFASATAKLAEVEGRLQTAVGRTTIETLKKQVGTIGDACGVR